LNEGVTARQNGVGAVSGTLQRFGTWAVSRGGIFVVELIYVLALWGIAILYFAGTIHPRHTIGNMPTAVPWFGALGAVLISLVGIFEHPLDWNPRMAPWHWARPFVGGSFAVVSVLILQAGIVSIGSDPHNPGKSLALYYIVGFVVGYREETFRELIKRLVDVLLNPGPGASDAAPTITSVSPASGQASASTDVTIDGTGFTKVISVKFGTKDATGVTTESPTRIKATAPSAAQPGGVSVLVTTKVGTATGDFTYT
jgi:hypothetical protein